jgi:hypothetical protein
VRHSGPAFLLSGLGIVAQTPAQERRKRWSQAAHSIFRAEVRRRSRPALTTSMTEQHWELYRLRVVDEWPESPYKAALIGTVKHKLMILALTCRNG